MFTITGSISRWVRCQRCSQDSSSILVMARTIDAEMVGHVQTAGNLTANRLTGLNGNKGDGNQVQEEQLLDEGSRNSEAQIVPSKAQLMALQSMTRTNEWASKTATDPKMLQSLQTGLVTTHQVHNHKFRDRHEDLELGQGKEEFKYPKR